MTSRLRTTAFWVLLAVLVTANAIVMLHSLLVLRFWEDEAFNLTVPRNLLAGWGYTSDGTLSGSTPTPFDPRISTGPVVLLPVAAVLATGLDPILGARLIPLAYWLLLLGGLAVLGRRLSGRFGALTAVTVPLAFDTAGGFSPIQGPADLLGEVAAAAWIVWGLVVLRRRPWLAGLFLGLAVQAKLIAVLALPAFAVALFLLAPPAPFAARAAATLRRGILPLLLAAAPTLLMELAALLSLGPDGYVRHVRSLGHFVLSGGQQYAPTTIPEKLATLAEAWFVPWPFVLAAGVLGLTAVVAAALAPALRAEGRIRGWPPHGPHLRALGIGSALGLLTFVGWWAQASQLPLWVRHPAVGVFAFTPVLAAVVVRAATALWHRSAHGIPAAVRGAHVARRAGALLSLAMLLVVGAGGAIADTARALSPPAAETLAQQRAAVVPVAAWVRDEGVLWIAAKPWGGPVSSIVLSGAHVGLFDAPAMRETPTLGGAPCAKGSALVSARAIVVCPAG
ncbi:hypothetical protein [uncultured Microbacterium sp.]|uniref:hypothetical protein n=1 Tax=uncultured Microbacterium sp. TaxID=191216 RepID=UPI0025E193EA|nr:hypothetical protein [uncultured Microbacterium sp.]